MLYLASRSPRRAELLRQLKVKFEIIDSEIDETPLAGESVRDLVIRLAIDKAKQGLRHLKPAQADDLVLASDTMIALDDEVIGKPASPDDCQRILDQLSGRSHRVVTGVALIDHRGTIRHACSDNEVSFRGLQTQEIRDYCGCGEPMDKAGAYAIQGMGAIFIDRISGSYSSIMGLSLFEIADLLKQAGYPILKNQDQLNHDQQ